LFAVRSSAGCITNMSGFDLRQAQRDELLNETLFTSLAQARVALRCWRADYNDARPHSQLGWKTPSEFAFTCHPPNRAIQTPGANSPLDKTWGQGHETCQIRREGPIAEIACLGLAFAEL
jgi:hypothetical protein